MLEGHSEKNGILKIAFEDKTKLEEIYYNNAFNGFTRIFSVNKKVFKEGLFNNEERGHDI